LRTLLPYPVLAVGLAAMWLLLSGVSCGSLVVAVAAALIATHALKMLGEASPHIRRWGAIVEFAGVMFYDIVQSNIAVATTILWGMKRPRRAGFVTIPLEMRSPSGLAVLAIVITSTPGTAWVDYNVARNELLIHVFDLVDEDEWVRTIKNRYERLLMETFE